MLGFSAELFAIAPTVMAMKVSSIAIGQAES